MYCMNCGAQLPESAEYCSVCGKHISKQGYNGNVTYNNMSATYKNAEYSGAAQSYTPHTIFYPNPVATVKASVATRELVSGIVWCCVAGVQLLLGFVSFHLFFIGAWNLVNAILGIVKSSSLKTTSGSEIYNQYEKDLGNIIIFAVINLVAGGVIGVVGAIFDLCTRNYVMKNREVLLSEDAN